MGAIGNSMSRDVKALTPADNNRLKISSVKGKAAGIPAVLSSGVHGISKMGMVKTIKTLTTINQNDGFDCPGCAYLTQIILVNSNFVKTVLKLSQTKQ